MHALAYSTFYQIPSEHQKLGDGRQERSIYRWVTPGGSFGGNPLRLEIGLGSAENIELIEVTWPTSETVQRFENVACDQFIEITEGSDQICVLA